MSARFLFTTCLTLCLIFPTSAARAAWTDSLIQHTHRLNRQEIQDQRAKRIRDKLVRHLGKLSTGEDINYKDKYGQTTLMVAAAANEAEIAISLLLQGADPGISSNKGKYAHTLCQAGFLQQLLERSVHGTPSTIDLHTAASMASDEESAIELLLLLRKGADINQTDSEGKTPLMLVAPENKTSAGVLIAAGARQEHWCAELRKSTKVTRLEVHFTHQGASPEELEAGDEADALALQELEAMRVKWRRFRDPILTSSRMRTCPYGFRRNPRKGTFTPMDQYWKTRYAHQEDRGLFGYHGHVQLGTITIHYSENVPPLHFDIQSGGRANAFTAQQDTTAPILKEGSRARLYTDCHGRTIKGFLISTLGREKLPQFDEHRSDIMLHLAPISVPGETPESTKRQIGSHGCISVLKLQDWQTIYSELRKMGGGGKEGIEIDIRYTHR